MAELRWGAATDAGLVREANEDAYVVEPLVFGVADGMGGHRAGEVASALASTTLRERLSGGAANVDVVVAAVLEANAAIFQAAHTNSAQQGMGTTITALAVMPASDDEPEQFALVNVGDSRTYLLRNGEMSRATIDHSYVQELVATGHITEAEARTHPRRNIVTRALGIEPNVRVDAWVLPLVRGDRFILCSDGLVDEVPDHEIADVAAGIADPQRAADELVAMANRHGGRDNTTVVVVDVIEGLDPHPEDLSVDADDAATTVLPLIAIDDVESAALHDTDHREADVAAVAATDDPDVDPAAPSDPDLTLVGELPSADDTKPMDVALIEEATERPRRRLTVRLFLVLLAIAAAITVVITLIAVAVSDDDSPTPSTTVPATTPARPTTTEARPTTTEAPSTTTDEPATTTDEPATTTVTTTVSVSNPPRPTTASATTSP